MKTVLIKTPSGLRGATPEDQDAWEKFKRKLETMKPGSWLRFAWSTPRNGKHHRKLMALIALVTENSETYRTQEQALVAIKLAAAYYDPHIDPRTGEVFPVVHSISFDAMGQEDFDKFYNAAIDGIVATILPQMDRETADKLLEMIIEGWS